VTEVAIADVHAARETARRAEPHTGSLARAEAMR
jgi:hypothetical protein